MKELCEKVAKLEKMNAAAKNTPKVCRTKRAPAFNRGVVAHKIVLAHTKTVHARQFSIATQFKASVTNLQADFQNSRNRLGKDEQELYLLSHMLHEVQMQTTKSAKDEENAFRWLTGVPKRALVLEEEVGFSVAHVSEPTKAHDDEDGLAEAQSRYARTPGERIGLLNTKMFLLK